MGPVGALIVDWLGQGGIFQTSRAWARVLADAGESPTVLTRSGGEPFGADPVRPVTARSVKIAAHAELVRAAAAEIRERSPRIVVVQNYLVPALEVPVMRAARAAGARLVLVVHNDRPHSLFAGAGAGLGRLLRAADVVVTHSRYVADRLPPAAHDVHVVEHPVPLGLVELAPDPSPERSDQPRTALTFGVLKRKYKGTSVITDLARTGVEGWRFVAAGVGAPSTDPTNGLESVPGFVPAGELVAMVQAADVCLLPYKHATQSGAVVLAQSLGTPVVASAVGGIPEQVTDHVNGRLVPAAAAPELWAETLGQLTSPVLHALGERARADAWTRHRRFADWVGQTLASA